MRGAPYPAFKKKAIKREILPPAVGPVDMWISRSEAETYPRDCGQPGGLSKAVEGNPQGCPQGRQDRHIHRPRKIRYFQGFP